MLRLVQSPASARHLRLDRTLLAAEWLLDSGICRPGFGIADEYRTDGREYAPVSNKAIACYVSTLIWLFKTRGETRYIDRALTTAQYLSQSALVMYVSAPTSETASDRQIDSRLDECSAILRALLRCWHVGQHSEFLTRAIECANFMQRIPGRCPLESTRGWLELAEETGNRRLQELHCHVLGWSLTVYPEFLEFGDGKTTVSPAAFGTKTARLPSTTLLARHCGFLEALLPTLERPGDQSRAARAFEKVFALTSAGLRSLSSEAVSGNTVPTEVCARLLRLRLYAAALGLIKLDADQAQYEAGIIGEMQADQYDPRIRGGFYTGGHSTIFERVVGLAATAVSLQALTQWQQFRNGDFRPDLAQLI